VSFANKAYSQSIPGSSKPIETWVTITPNKCIRANKSPKVKPSTVTIIPPGPEPIIPVPASSSMPTPLNPVSVSPEGIILASTVAVTPSVGEPEANGDPLVAFHGEFLEGMEDNTNVDMFLNLHNIADIEMSTDSAKRK